MVQADTDNNMNEINYNYARTNKKGIILLPESLRIDNTQKEWYLIPHSAEEDKLEFTG